MVDAIQKSGNNFVVIYPNNDLGSELIIHSYKSLNPDRFKIFSSLRFEYFLVLLKNADFIIGNSSAGIREAPYYGIPTVNIGTRQNQRALSKDIIHCGYQKREILNAIQGACKLKIKKPGILAKAIVIKYFLNCLVLKKYGR